jgi:hypothetical protein
MCLRAGSWLLLFLGATWAAADGKTASHSAIALLVLKYVLSSFLEEKQEITKMGISMRHCYHDLL